MLYHNTEWCELWIQIRVWREWQNILLERVGWCAKRRHFIASTYAASYFPHPCTLIMSFKSQCDRFRKELVIRDLYTYKEIPYRHLIVWHIAPDVLYNFLCCVCRGNKIITAVLYLTLSTTLIIVTWT